jgi:hypothetical protein
VSHAVRFDMPRVVIDGVDVSRLVRSIEVRSSVGSITETTLTLIGSPRIVGDVIEFRTGAPSLSDHDADAPRAIRFGMDPQS